MACTIIDLGKLADDQFNLKIDKLRLFIYLIDVPYKSNLTYSLRTNLLFGWNDLASSNLSSFCHHPAGTYYAKQRIE